MKKIQVTVKNDGNPVSHKDQQTIIEKIMELKNHFGTAVQIDFT